MDKLISNPDKSVGMSDLSELYTVFKHYAVLKKSSSSWTFTGGCSELSLQKKQVKF